MKIDKRSNVEGFSTLTLEQMMNINGGVSAQARFTCTCTGENGQTIVTEASSIEECWASC